MNISTYRRGQEGFALLLVLWAISLLALLATQVTAAGRVETRVSLALVRAAAVQEAADAAVTETIWHLLPGAREQWQPQTGVRSLREGRFQIAVSIIDQRGKVDFNTLPTSLVASLFRVLGSDHDTATTLAETISEWHSNVVPDGVTPTLHEVPPWGAPHHDFQRLDELLLVPGMTAALYHAALPHLALHLDQGPLASLADPVVRMTMEQDKRETGVEEAEPDPNGMILVEIVAHAAEPGAAFTRRAIVRLGADPGRNAALYRILEWNDGEAPRG